MGLAVEARRRRQPARARSAAAASGRSCCAPTWTRCRPPRRSSRCWSTARGRTRNDGILGADNKAAVAMLLELARRCSVEGSPVGARARCSPSPRRSGCSAPSGSTPRSCRSEFGYVFDHATADRRGRHRLADALPRRGRVPRQVRARRPAPGGGPLGDPRRRPRRRAHAARPDRRPRRRRTSATSTAASSPPTSSPSARGCSPRSARWTRTRPRTCSRR